VQGRIIGQQRRNACEDRLRQTAGHAQQRQERRPRAGQCARRCCVLDASQCGQDHALQVVRRPTKWRTTKTGSMSAIGLVFVIPHFRPGVLRAGDVCEPHRADRRRGDHSLSGHQVQGRRATNAMAAPMLRLARVDPAQLGAGAGGGLGPEAAPRRLRPAQQVLSASAPRSAHSFPPKSPRGAILAQADTRTVDAALAWAAARRQRHPHARRWRISPSRCSKPRIRRHCSNLRGRRELLARRALRWSAAAMPRLRGCSNAEHTLRARISGAAGLTIVSGLALDNRRRSGTAAD